MTSLQGARDVDAVALLAELAVAYGDVRGTIRRRLYRGIEATCRRDVVTVVFEVERERLAKRRDVFYDQYFKVRGVAVCSRFAAVVATAGRIVAVRPAAVWLLTFVLP